VAFDELTSFTEWQYLYVTLQRVRTVTGSGLPQIVRSASNPGNIGHNWVRKRFIDPCPTGGTVIENSTGIKRIFIPATIDDNPYIDPNYRKSLEAIPDAAERNAKLYGNWDAYEGQVFEEFRDKRWPEEPDNALHVIEPFDIPDWWPKIVAMDWGYALPAMTYVCYGAISPEKKVYIYREQAFQKMKIAEWAPYVKEYLDLEQPRRIKLCRSGGQDRGQEHTIQGDIEQELGWPTELTSNSPGSRVAGKMLLHEYLRWREKYVPEVELVPYNQEHADWLLRNRGMREYESYLESYKPKERENNLPRLQIFSNCKLLITAIKSAVYDKTNVQDVAEFPGDDPYDTIRYLIDACDRYFDEASNEFERIQKTEQLVKQLNATQDWTTYYRNARKLESNSGDYVRPVRRYHAH
jgi:hypothetical protein